MFDVTWGEPPAGRGLHRPASQP
ncbi:hypothetical protein CBM2587_A10300 [Cupriavidus taiwanensis]|uniref:Uncharacterized protein n=1 Tax=Cupriavidus taiwanensis TaxID=164546 RepID=A0A375BCP3_9BURK|nr:hypothetical protein CBM2587_A10300 [Cupriavidus taiwanensis]